jgi:hypothetical protein
LLFFLCDAIFMKNICHTCSVEKIWCVDQVPLLADFFIFAREICIKHAYDKFYIVFVYYVDHGKNIKSVVLYFS